MAEEQKVIVVDATTGEIYGPKPRKTKRLEPFFMTEQKAAIELAKLNLTATEYRILLYLQGIADYDNVAQTSQAFLAKELKTTEATISLCLKHMAELEVITKEPHYRGQTAFRINPKISSRGKAKG